MLLNMLHGVVAAGFDDPEVMAAVNDVAQNPQNMKKYQNNPKVRYEWSLYLSPVIACYGNTYRYHVSDVLQLCCM